MKCSGILQREFTGVVDYQGTGIDLGSPFRRASMVDLVTEARYFEALHNPPFYSRLVHTALTTPRPHMLSP